MRWNVLYERIKPDLSAEAEDRGGKIPLKILNEIIEDNVGYDERTKKRVREILVGRNILKNVAPGVYEFTPFLKEKEKGVREHEGEASEGPSTPP
jgi:hypothetical protein